MSNREHNERQFALMARCISDYETGRIGLGRIVSDLEALGSALEGDFGSFRHNFRSLWGQLEVTLAVMRDEGRDELNETDERIVSEAISELKSLIDINLTDLTDEHMHDHARRDVAAD